MNLVLVAILGREVPQEDLCLGPHDSGFKLKRLPCLKVHPTLVSVAGNLQPNKHAQTLRLDFAIR